MYVQPSNHFHISLFSLIHQRKQKSDMTEENGREAFIKKGNKYLITMPPTI